MYSGFRDRRCEAAKPRSFRAVAARKRTFGCLCLPVAGQGRRHPTATVKHLVVYFYANSVEVNDPNIGYQTPTTDYWVVGLAPVQDFEDMYKILLTEKAVYFLRAVDSNDKLFWFGISSKSEPIGHN